MPTMHIAPPAAIAVAETRLGLDQALAAAGFRDPEAVVTLAPIVLRASAPSNLGDADASTIQSDAVSPGTANPAGGTIEVKATAMQDVALQTVGTIDHVVFRCIAWRADNAGTAPFHLNFRMGWRVGADSAEAAITNDAAAGSPSGTPFRLDADGVDAGDILDSSYFVSTGPIALQPNGQPWDIAALNALQDVAVRYDYAAGVEWAELEVAEIWVEVFGPMGAEPSIISPRLLLGGPSGGVLNLTGNPE